MSLLSGIPGLWRVIGFVMAGVGAATATAAKGLAAAAMARARATRVAAVVVPAADF